MKLVKILIALCLYIEVPAQQYDVQWVLSDLTSIVDFRNDTITLKSIQNTMPMFLTSANICNKNGELLYFTNGIYIADANGDTLSNGTGLSPCDFTTQWANSGLDIQQGALFLPKPGNDRYYYLFHFSNDTLNDARPGTIYYSLIDTVGSKVIEKNIVVCKLKFREGGMTACKHANGRDYWIVMGGSNNNEFYKFLLTPDSILGPFIQSIGPVFHLPYDNAYSKFSLDGSKYVTSALEGSLLVLSFDRCSGEFSNPVNIYNNTSTDPLNHPDSGSAAVEFSPNGRFVYADDRISLTQYDLLSTNIQDSVVIYNADTNDYAQINMLQLGPNGKLYASCWAGGFYILHVVNAPDDKGDSCAFVYGGLTTLTANSGNLPNMINYKLGVLSGSGCDTITSVSNNQWTIANEIRTWPNPADKYIYVEMGAQGRYEFILLNEAGQLIDKKETRQVDIFDTEKLVGGLYFIKVVNKNNGEVTSKKIVILH